MQRVKRTMLPIILTIVLYLLGVPVVAMASSNTLTWTDNSNNELNFNIERTTAANVPACQTATGFTVLASVGTNVATYTDSAVVEGTTYCYRVNASNTAGISGFSNIAGRTVPFTIPAAPTGLGATAGP